MATGGASVRRWGGRALALAVTGVGLYVVTPSLLSAFGAWPRLAEVQPHWFLLLVLLETGSPASLWWLTRLALAPHPEDGNGSTPPPQVRWGTVASSQLAGSAASKVVPGGAATGGVVQAKVLIQAGQPAAAVTSALTGVGLITTAVLLLLPVLTVPALLIGPPPAEQLQLGLLVSLIVAIVIVAVGVIVLMWPRVLIAVGRLVGHVLGRVRSTITPDSVATMLSGQRARVAAAFEGRWWVAVFLAAAHRMFDYAALVAALAAFGVHARPSEVLLAFVVAQALAMVPITPGGLGFVESGLSALLVVIGVPVDVAVVATLLYRLVSFWLPIPVGVLAWAGWRFHTRRADPTGERDG
jgi:uncharacterized protein (TIRG00374 family)